MKASSSRWMCVCVDVSGMEGGNLSVMSLSDAHLAVFAVQMVLGKGQQVGMAVHVQVGGVDGLGHQGCVRVMVVHKGGGMMMVHQRSRVVGVVVQVAVVQVSVVQVSVQMGVLIDMCVVVDDVMIDHGVPVVQEVVGFIVHNLVHMVHRFHLVDGLVADNLGRGMHMSVMMHIGMSVMHIGVIQVSRVAVVMIDWMCVHMMFATIDHNGGAVTQVHTVRVMHIGIHEVRQMIVVMMLVLQMGQQTGLSHAQQGQGADKELQKIASWW